MEPATHGISALADKAPASPKAVISRRTAQTKTATLPARHGANGVNAQTVGLTAIAIVNAFSVTRVDM